MTAQNGNRVKVQFIGRLEDGTVFGEARADKPLEFTLGEERIITGFEEAVRGMEAGQQKTVQVPPEKGFGPYDPAKVLNVERRQLAKSEPLVAGTKLSLADSNGREHVGQVKDVSPTSVKLDLNHPLAGHRLEFQIALQQVA